MPTEQFKWGILILDCLSKLRTRPELLSVPFTDYEVIPPFDGLPDNMFIWFICTTRSEAERFRRISLDAATARLKKDLIERGFPSAALDSLQSDCVSTEEIDAGGGRFYYFR